MMSGICDCPKKKPRCQKIVSNGFMEYYIWSLEQQGKKEICQSCRGSGRDPMSDIVNWLPCGNCAGTGYLDKT